MQMREVGHRVPRSLPAPHRMRPAYAAAPSPHAPEKNQATV